MVETYITQDNGIKTYKVHVNDNKLVKIYIDEDYNYDFEPFKEYKCLEVFIGKSPRNGNTDRDCVCPCHPNERVSRYGEEYDGNTILLKIGEKRYVYIGGDIKEFSTTDDIVEYISEVGNNEVPYALAIGQEYIYFMMDNCRISLDKFPKLTEKVKEDAYGYFYGHIDCDYFEGDDCKRFLEYKYIDSIF